MLKICAIVTASTEEIATGDLTHCLASLRGQVDKVILVWRDEDHGVSASLPPDIGARVDVICCSGLIGVAAARNCGLRQALEHGWLEPGWAVSFPDDDCWYPPDLTASICDALSAHDFVMIPYGPDVAGVDRQRFPVAGRAVNASFAVASCASVGLFIRAEWFRLEGFDEALGAGTDLAAGEDVDLVLRLVGWGARGQYLPEPIVRHPYRANLRDARAAGGVAAVLRGMRAYSHRLLLVLIRLLAGSALHSMRSRSSARVRSALYGLRRHPPRIARICSEGVFQDLGFAKIAVGDGLSVTLADPFEVAVRASQATPREAPCVLLASHISSLLASRHPHVQTAYDLASGSYADGVSVSLAARLRGHYVRKVATTDLAPRLIRDLYATNREHVRVAIIGGEPGIAAKAADALRETLPVEIVYTDHGYHLDWREPLSRLQRSAPHITILGLGMPLEARWVLRHSGSLPTQSILVTCGGWLRLLAGVEKRSPAAVQRVQLEWLYRLACDPKRTAGRYARGFIYLVVAGVKSIPSGQRLR